MSNSKKNFLEEAGLKFYLARLTNTSIGVKDEEVIAPVVDTCKAITNDEIAEDLEVII